MSSLSVSACKEGDLDKTVKYLIEHGANKIELVKENQIDGLISIGSDAKLLGVKEELKEPYEPKPKFFHSIRPWCYK